MLGTLLGIVLATGLVLVFGAVSNSKYSLDNLQERAASSQGSASGETEQGIGTKISLNVTKLNYLLAEAGVSQFNWKHLLAVSLGGALFAAALVQLLFGVAGLSTLAMLAFGLAPTIFLKGRARKRQRSLSELWPDLIELLRASVRSGETLEHALAGVGAAAPQTVSSAFEKFSIRIQQGWSFHSAVESLKFQLADPVSDQVIETLKIAKDIGGVGVGDVLGRLSQTVRTEARLLAELESRQSWHINAARLAAFAPWMVLAVMALRLETRQAFTTDLGTLLIFAGAAVTIIAYRTMVRIARFQSKERWLI